MRAWNKNFFSKENAAPSGMITVPRDTLDSDMDVIRQQIWDYFGSGQRRVGVARAGDLAWTAFDRSQKDMEFLSGREFARTEISRAFGIPDGYWDKDATRANAEGAKATMIETAVWPKLVLLMEDLNAQAAPNWIEDDDIRITFDDIRPRNVSQELQEFTTHSPVLTVNELRALAHYDPLPDYRGLMLLEEMKKGAPLPTTVPALLAEQTAAEQAEREQAELLAKAESAMTEMPSSPPMPVSGESTTQEALLEEQTESEAELKRWERKALKSFKRTGRANVPFASGAIDVATKASIAEALMSAQTLTDVRAAFKSDIPRVSYEESLEVLHLVEEEALRWARWALEERG